ncbi:TRAP transporter substrate-binding protein [Tropicimonas sediminicola]|uniref:TRAP-type C4-dicarboxylate transport system, substrate-binding protein n=1 Tax=Tropicimonas sediminicola TaxID=1031541 RepID=A0A239I056_9RHOB|nr:TRAP transporter substrate-binding protein [Tropicimonas sediminicola]SNS86772.1 TRAP-type C4-dicarboxylate transport system, substrate-binding protein [Tropicimonas sediminicola]
MTEPIRISLGGYQGPGSVHTRALSQLQDAIERRTGGAVEVRIRANVAEDGHGTADLPDLVESGQLDGCYISSSYLSDRIQALSLFDMPFAVPDRDAALALLDGALGARFAQEVEAHTGLVLLGIWDNGLRHISTADRPLHRPAQGKCLVLRTLPNADHQRAFRTLGFEPRVVDAKDLAGAVSRGEVDAQENPLTNTYNFGLHETLPTITLTGHLMGIALLLFNRARLQALPEAIRAAVRAAATEASRAQRELAREDDAHCARALLEAGATMHHLTAEDRAAWRDAAEPELARSRARFDPDLLSLFQTGLEARGRAPA